MKSIHNELIMSSGVELPEYQLQTDAQMEEQKVLLKKRYDIMHNCMTALEKDYPWHYKEAMKAKPREDLIFPKELRTPVEDM